MRDQPTMFAVAREGGPIRTAAIERELQTQDELCARGIHPIAGRKIRGCREYCHSCGREVRP
jgi:hypothetical protein